ncbi:putative oxygenase [Streptomyces sulfonofaciens]|uniref:Oxygenase n=1 Tax=Streptomyces sulfonofaciens TaxID=68272 RepID=A0A919GPI4_9ACTN|nr:FAD-dependent monooxygenase [Streptomyces sulfonofaciens]GHH88403.1 putative oxygenase [Streptomyces sulfonofaciens]
MTEPVLIAGGGPVGMMLACELGLAGVPVLVLERLAAPNERSRGMAVNSAVVELLAQRGLMESLAGDGFEFPRAHFAHIFLDPERLGTRHPYTFAVPHSKVELRLAQRAEALGVTIRRDAELVSLDQDARGVTAVVRAADGTEERVGGSYLVGCDGGDSAVRRLAGIGFPGVDSAFHGITGDIAVEGGDKLFELLGFHQHDAGFFTVAPAGPDLLRVTTGEFDREVAPDTPLTRDDLYAALERITGIGLDTGTARWLAHWYAPTRQAERYRAGRVLVAGDAAHVHFPLGGQALSTGLEDAVNLGWKLAAEVRGRAPEGLLDTYHAERHPVGARACRTTRAQMALMHPMDRVGPLRDVFTELVRLDEVNAYLVEMAGGLDVRYPFACPDGAAGAEPHPLLGTRLPDAPLVTGDGATSVYRLLHSGRGVLLDLSGAGAPPAPSGPGVRRRAEAAAGWSDRVAVAVAEPTDEIGAAALLLRPDGRVAWAVADAAADASPATALRTWFGAPTAS